MKQTAMMELIDIMNKDQVSFTEWFLDNYQIYIQKEKEQIMDARMQDMDSGLDPSTYIDIAEDYYNETYLNKKL